MQGRRRCHTGFALLDVMIAMVLVGLAVSAMVQLFYTGTMVNGEATRLTVAVNLAQNIHEYAMTLPHRGLYGRVGRTHGEYPGGLFSPDPALNKAADDISDLDNWTFDQVVDSKCLTVVDPDTKRPLLPGWSQYCQVSSVVEGSLTGTASLPSGTAPKRLIVTVRYQNNPVYTEQWILAPTVQPD